MIDTAQFVNRLREARKIARGAEGKGIAIPGSERLKVAITVTDEGIQLSCGTAADPLMMSEHHCWATLTNTNASPLPDAIMSMVVRCAAVLSKREADSIEGGDAR
jgi:hypothetical protein